MEISKCVKCGNAASAGFILETGHYNFLSASQWVEGKPEPSFWGNGLNFDNKAAYPITAYRCASCGHLEFYANAEVEKVYRQAAANTLDISNPVLPYIEADQNSFECINCETTVPIDTKICPNCGLDFYPPE
jgi:hypothetical protein